MLYHQQIIIGVFASLFQYKQQQEVRNTRKANYELMKQTSACSVL